MALFKRRRGKIGTIAHVLTALVIIVHGYEKMEKGESSYPIFYIAGFVFLLIVALHKPISRHFKWSEGIFHFIEALVLFVIAYDYFHHGKTALPICYMIAGLGHIVASVVVGRKGMKEAH